jgi:hypothetical protein
MASLRGHTATGALTNDGVVVGRKLSCLDSGLEFHTISPMCSEVWLFSGMPSLRGHTATGALTNDGVVVGGKLSCLDSGFEFHTILLSVQRFDCFEVWPHFAAAPPPEH